MSQIKVTNEISERLSSFQSAVNANANFCQLQQLSFENTQFPSLTGYQTAIQTVGRLGDSYRAAFVRDIASCEQIVENMRNLDQQAGQAMMAAV